MILNEIKLAGQVTRRVYQRALDTDPTKDYYYIMRDTTNIQPVIVEYGFLDNVADATRLRYNWKRYAEATVKATCDYIGYPYKPPYSEEIVYTVQPGDTLFSIARRFQTTTDAIMRQNNLTSTTINVGQRLLIPFFGTTPEVPEETFTYTVVAGDTLFSLANRFNTTVAEIKRLNNLTSDVLSIGQQLLIPGTEITPPPMITHTVVAGDTLFSLANRYNTTVNEIMRQNNLTSTALRIGQQLLIPGSTPPPEPPEPPIITRPTLRYGDRGEDVVDLQRLLESFGYSPGVIDGVFGSGTLNAVRAFQTARGLAADGVVGSATWNALLSETTPITYIVVSGDSLYSIANRFGTTVDAIMRLNNLTSTNLTIGQRLLIPVGETPPSYITYTVVSGDSLWSIANRFRTTVEEIRRINNLTSNLLSIGQVLKIPN